ATEKLCKTSAISDEHSIEASFDWEQHDVSRSCAVYTSLSYIIFRVYLLFAVMINFRSAVTSPWIPKFASRNSRKVESRTPLLILPPSRTDGTFSLYTISS